MLLFRFIANAVDSALRLQEALHCWKHLEINSQIFGFNGGIEMSKCLDLSDSQKMRYSKGSVVYNTNNYRFAIVMDGSKGDNSAPSSLVLEQNVDGTFIIHTPPNRALIPTGRYIDLNSIIKQMEGQY